MSGHSNVKSNLLEAPTNAVRALESVGLRASPETFRPSPIHLVKPEGQLHVHTASFRGSFSIVLSTAIRTAGLGSRVMVAQFLKGGVNQGPEGSEILCGNLIWLRPAIQRCISMHKDKNETQNDFLNAKEAVQSIWNICQRNLLTGDVDQLVLDELGLAISLGYLKKETVITALEQRPRTMDIILTGPSIPESITSMADQVTELRCGL